MRNWIAALALVMAGGALGAEEPKRSAAESMDVLMWNREPVGGPFALIDHHGKRRTDADFRGRLMLVYFGYTFCPDVCPTDLLEIGQAMQKLGPQAKEVQPLFITLDPARDSAKHLAGYVPHFHPAILGLTGKAEAIAAAANAYKVYYKKVPGLSAAAYSVDHTAFLYLMDRKGQYLGFFPPGTTADRMLEIIRPHLR
jgi:cytochrome oxidase Cu insertion factor (SCO1/SenC/PrrC family)